MTGETDQEDVIAFLRSPAAYGGQVRAVRQHTTHISHVFLAGDRAYKLKRAVKLPYVDFSTEPLRRAACARELTLNRRIAPQLYHCVVPVTRTDAGGLQIGGAGAALDWLVVMRRFDDDSLLDAVARRGDLTEKTIRELADAIAAAHAAAEIATDAGGAASIAEIVAGNDGAFVALSPGTLAPERVARVQAFCRAALAAQAPLLDRRRAAGKVRRCHGDLHLGNIVLLDGHPVMFDCLDFSDTLSTIDVLYDLAFPVMDLLHLGLPVEANALCNRYLDRSDEQGGSAVLPLFLAVRAAIRAHVIGSDRSKPAHAVMARSYLDLALAVAAPAPASLLAVGGFSGTGKSTLALRLAPDLGRSPGARVLRSDVIRKRLFGCPPEARLDQDAYRHDVTERVYGVLMEEAAALLAAGQAVIADAVFARPEERAAIAATASQAGVPFAALWLDAPAEILARRVAARRDDASDADVAVLRRQLGFDTGVIDWTLIDVSGSIDDSLARARQALAAVKA